MAKKQLKKYESRPREEKLGLMKTKKDLVQVSFRLGARDRKNLATIASLMDAEVIAKKITLTDAIKALIQVGMNTSSSRLMRAFQESM